MSNENNSLYRRIIADAFRVTLGHVHLWLFGAVVAATGFGGVFEVFLRDFGAMTSRVAGTAAQPNIVASMPALAALRAAIFGSGHPWLALLLFSVALAALAAIALYVGGWAIAALISGIRKIIRGGDVHFRDGLETGRKRAVQTGLVLLAQKACLAGLLLLGAANVAAAMPYGTGPLVIPLYIGSYALIGALVFAVIVAMTFAANYAVIQNLEARRAIAEGWGLLQRNWLVAIEMIVVLFALDIVASALSIVLLVAFAAPGFMLVSLAALAGIRGIIWALYAATAAAVLVSVILLGSFYATLRASAWTLLWTELAEKRRTPRLHHYVGLLKKRVIGG